MRVGASTGAGCSQLDENNFFNISSVRSLEQLHKKLNLWMCSATTHGLLHHFAQAHEIRLPLIGGHHIPDPSIVGRSLEHQ